MKRSPLRAKRDRPRRNEGRVQHERVKPKTVEPTAEQRRYHDWLRAKGRCEASGVTVDLVLHHILSRAPGKVGRRDHWFVVLISAALHNGRTDSVHLLGSEAEFLRVHGVDLVAVACARLEEYRNV